MTILKNISQVTLFFKILGKSFIWAIGTLLLGLLQLILVLAHDFLTIKDYFKFEQFIFDGSLLFFAAAVVSSITIDYLLSMRTSCCKPRQIFLFIIFPLFVILCCVALFYMIYGQNPDNFKLELLSLIEMSILIATFLYGIVVKYHAFKL
jgi:hypothetical protein